MLECRICGNKEANVTYEAREMMYGLRDSFVYFQCRACGCLQIESIPEDVSKYYPKDYYSFKVPGPKGTLDRFLERLRGWRDRSILTGGGMFGRLLKRLYPDVRMEIVATTGVRPEHSILDVGCGVGTLLQRMQRAGYKNVAGADPFIEADINYENGLRIAKQFIHECTGNYDLIMFHHAFEHVEHQLDTLKSVRERLNPTGTCLIRVPTVSSWAWEEYREHWVGVDAPRHYFLHSLESMNILAAAAGLRVYKVLYDSVPSQFWASEQYRKDIPLRDQKSYGVNPRGSIFSEAQIKDFKRRTKLLNENGKGDAIAFFLCHQ